MKRILKLQFKILLLLTCIVSSASLNAQTVDIVASVDVTPPLSVGQTFTYTIEAIAGTTNYRGVQVYLDYNPAVIQLNSLTPVTTVLNVPLANDTTIPGVIRYSAGSFADVSGTTTIFTAVFEVVGTSESVMITHDLFTNGNANGTGVSNATGQNITGTTNDIILTTLSTENNAFNTSLSVYPNPVNDVLNTNLSRATSNIKSIAVHTIDGRLVQNHNTINSNRFQINTTNLDHAMYFVTITSVNKEKATFKILVN